MLTSWAAVASSPPKSNKQEVQVQKRTDLLLAEAPAITATSTIFKAMKKPATATRALVRVQKWAQCERNHVRQLNEEERGQLLSRYRDRLIQSSALPRPMKGRLLSRRKQLSRLKAGIMRDRIVRRTLRQMALASDAAHCPFGPTHGSCVSVSVSVILLTIFFLNFGALVDRQDLYLFVFKVEVHTYR